MYDRIKLSNEGKRLFMDEMDKKELEQIINVITEVVDVETVYLFGSFAYGTPNKDSDFDLYVVLADGAERPLKAVQKMNMAIARMDIRSVDILAEESKRFYEKCTAMTLERTVRDKGVKLYEGNAQLYQSMA